MTYPDPYMGLSDTDVELDWTALTKTSDADWTQSDWVIADTGCDYSDQIAI
jgi:hypothetical protein